MKTFLFQGDSITDCGRSRNYNDLGNGYPVMVAGELGYNYPEKFTFINKAISGNRMVDLYARIKCELINLKPDVLTILIGVNDVWHELDCNNGSTPDKFKKLYSMFLDEIKLALPDLKIYILEPFVLKADSTSNCKGHTFEEFKDNTLAMAAAAKEISEEYNIKFITLQDKFDEASKETANEYWLSDGVHPTTFGHKIIAKAVLAAIEDEI